MEYCGIKLDKDKWTAKMKKDKEREEKAREMLDDWLISNMPHSKYISKNIQGDLFQVLILNLLLLLIETVLLNLSLYLKA